MKNKNSKLKLILKLTIDEYCVLEKVLNCNLLVTGKGGSAEVWAMFAHILADMRTQGLPQIRQIEADIIEDLWQEVLANQNAKAGIKRITENETM